MAADSPEDGQGAGEASQLPALPSAADALSRTSLPPIPIYGLSDARTQRLHEATVREAETRAEQAADNRKLRKRIAGGVSAAVILQITVADVVFAIYGATNAWVIPGSAIIAWLSATVVQVIALAVIVTESLFPRRGKRPADPSHPDE